MSDFNYPKVLIFSQPFNTNSGGGITLTNLFASWPKDKVAVISYPFMLTQVSTDVCSIYYQIGVEELHWAFPFSLIKEKPKSGIFNPISTESRYITHRSNGVRVGLSSSILNPLLKWSGLVHTISRLQISENLKVWLSEYGPDILYLQISNRESIKFSVELINYLNIPTAIHMMDDWPSTISNKGFARFLWEKRIDREFKHLLSKIDLHLSICDEMSSEYLKRYGYKFISFHNTIDLDRWTPFIRKDLSLSDGPKILLFSGRIGTGIKESLIELATVIDDLNNEGIDVRFHIQSTSKDPILFNQLKKHKCVVIKPNVEYSKIPELYSSPDILVIANDFSADGIRFLRYSMPTKAPEYLISGTPVLVYASSDTALHRMFLRNKVGHCVGSQDPEELKKAIKLLLNDLEYRKMLSENAVTFATDNFDSIKLRNKFQALLIETAQKKKT